MTRGWVNVARACQDSTLHLKLKKMSLEWRFASKLITLAPTNPTVVLSFANDCLDAFEAKKLDVASVLGEINTIDAEQPIETLNGLWDKLTIGRKESCDPVSVRRRLTAFANASCGPEECCDPNAKAFWEASEQPMSLSKFFSSFVAYVQSNGISKDAIARFQMHICMKKHVLEDIQYAILGSCRQVTKQHLQRMLDVSAAYVFPQGVLDYVLKLAESAPPIDPDLDGVVSRAELKNVETVRLQLRDYGCELSELGKLTSFKLQRQLLACGIDETDARTLALAVYMNVRPHQPNTVEAKTKLDRVSEYISRRDQCIDMSSCCLDAVALSPYVKALVSVGTVTSLDISSNNIHADGAKQIAQMIPSVPHLRSLYLYGNNIQCSGIRHICEALAAQGDAMSLTALDVSECHGAPQAAQVLAEYVPKLKNLRKLWCGGNDFGNSGCEHLAVVVGSPFLEELGLSSNSIDDVGASSLSRELLNGKASALSMLQLADNRITDQGISLIVKSVQCPCLVHLDISYNPIRSAESIALLANSNVQVSATGCSNEVRKKAAEINECIEARKVSLLGSLKSTVPEKWKDDEVFFFILYVLHHPVLAQKLRGMDGKALCTFSPSKAQDLHVSGGDLTALMGAINDVVR